ncbi:beta-mannosidase [Celeribacter sp.]|uniref:beta-mannosidase n=1 Tax=Celeribacter sp. TaxID=1890673 RepID=UPI003A8F8839
MPDTVSSIDLCKGWSVTNGAYSAPLDVPGDVHSALLAKGVITDPYWRDTEASLDWIHESTWIARKTFDLERLPTGLWTLSFDSIDGIAEVVLNGHSLGKTDNQFLRQDFDASVALCEGENTLEVRFASTSKTALDRAKASPFPIPYLDFNCRLPHYNFLRKSQCDAGWDWNIALSPLGLRGEVRLRHSTGPCFDDVMVRQIHANDGRVTLEADICWHATELGMSVATLACDGKEAQVAVQVLPGEHMTTLSLTLDAPELWWPAGEGEQRLYDLSISLGGERRTQKIGLRHIELITQSDEIGQSFTFRVNGRDMFIRGTNWVPADALPARATPGTVRDLLQSARDANMNMIRVWGGGLYEPDWFYDLCSEMGLLVWQDFMFACNLYPAQDFDWLNSVRKEADQQLKRLSSQPCLALWCGDNEVIGALNWFEESKKDRDRYLAIYARLNAALEEAVDRLRPDVAFWPSSPSVGRLNFGDGWHDDRSGDMHFWDVWHSAKDFEHYRTVRPRFCSEFGFQSFPSNRVIKSFTEERDRNVSTPVMDTHQRNPGGNSRIVETISRYFRFPDAFEDMTWMSQVSQGLAMKTAIEFWRSNKPRTMGTLYWQLNDTWPVASWASLEYGGGWKLVHYMARRFYAPVLVTAQPDHDTGEIVLWAINDSPTHVVIDLTARRVAVSGGIENAGSWTVQIPTDRSIEIARLPLATFGHEAFLHFDWHDESGRHSGHNDYLPLRPKAYDFSDPGLTTVERDGVVTLSTKRPALFVTLDHGGSSVWSDNCFTLLPGHDRVLEVVRKRPGPTGGPDTRWLNR